jgi:nucleotide-binding universal stress UspA family protein
LRRIIVPLDGSAFSEAILPDARDLAGADGELILLEDAAWPLFQREMFVDTRELQMEDSESYLQQRADKLRAEGVNVRTQSILLADAVSTIDTAVRVFEADMVAIATHGRRPMGRLIRGGTAWRALAQSPVPVLLHHFDGVASKSGARAGGHRIMVPLDGSPYGEKALPVAEELALEWNAPLWLVRVVHGLSITEDQPSADPAEPPEVRALIEDSDAYLNRIAGSLAGEMHTLSTSSLVVVDSLIECAAELSVSHIVMASHGLTGLSRVILGSVTDGVVHGLHIPVIVIPALAVGRLEDDHALGENQCSPAIQCP